MRLFVGLDLPESIKAALMASMGGVANARWQTAEQLHLTLRFIGDVNEAIARDIDTELGRIIAAPFAIALSGVGSFGGREPSALWAGVSAPPDLARLGGACESAIRACRLAPESRRYRPHVTLAYLNGASDHDVAHFLSDAAEFRTAPFQVDHFCMYASRATRAGSHYTQEAVYPLVG